MDGRSAAGRLTFLHGSLSSSCCPICAIRRGQRLKVSVPSFRFRVLNRWPERATKPLDVLHDLRWQSDFLAGSFGQVNQLFLAAPRPDAPRRPLADVVAVIPDEIDLGTQPDQLLPARRILDAEAEGLVELGLVGHRPHGFMVEHTRNARSSRPMRIWLTLCRRKQRGSAWIAPPYIPVLKERVLRRKRIKKNSLKTCRAVGRHRSSPA